VFYLHPTPTCLGAKRPFVVVIMSPLPDCRIFVCTCLCMDLYAEKLLAFYLIHLIPSASCSYSANSSKICSVLAICIKGISFMGVAVKWDSWLVCMLHCNNVFSFLFPTEEQPFILKFLEYLHISGSHL
jgi:hypothetical protein